MVMTLSTCHGQSQPNGPRRVHTVDDIGSLVFLGNRPSLERNHVIAVESACDLLLNRRVGKKVAGDLVDGELVEGEVRVEGVDDPFAPTGHVATAIDMVA